MECNVSADGASLAILMTVCGPLHIYTLASLKELVGVLPSFGWINSDQSGTPSPIAKNFAESPVLHEGYTAEQWARHAKHKAKIASSVCKQNGHLKLLLASAGADAAEKIDYKIDVGNDPLSILDPWLGAQRYPERDNRPRTLPCEPGEEDLWSDWANRQVAKNPWPGIACENLINNAGKKSVFKGDWKTLPDGSWHQLHGKFSSSATHANLSRPVLLAEEVKKDSLAACLDMKVATRRKEHTQFQFKPSVATWFGLSAEKEIVRRIRGINCSAWDPITEDAVAVGALVLADTTINADSEGESVDECARGIILSCDRSMICKIGFLNGTRDLLTLATIQLPDDRILQPVPNESDESDMETWSHSSE